MHLEELLAHTKCSININYLLICVSVCAGLFYCPLGDSKRLPLWVCAEHFM